MALLQLNTKYKWGVVLVFFASLELEALFSLTCNTLRGGLNLHRYGVSSLRPAVHKPQ